MRAAIVAFGPWRRLGRELLWAAGVGLVSAVAAAIVLRLTPETLGSRWTSGIADDNTLHYLVATSAVDSPFLIGPNPHLGFPGAQTLFFAPQYDPASAVLLTLIGFATHNGVLTLNLYHLLSFVLVGAASSLLFSALRVRRPIGVLLALVLTLAPYHFQRVAFGHAFVADYWAVPVAIVLILMAAGPSANPLESWASSGSRVMRRARRWVPILLLTLAVSLSLSYYFVFCILIMGGMVLACAVRILLTRGRWRDLVWPAITTASLVTFVGIQLAVLSLNFGERYENYFSGRTAGLSELFGGKITSLLLPWSSSGFRPLAQIGIKYAADTRVAAPAEPPGTPMVAAIAMGMIVVFILGRLLVTTTQPSRRLEGLARDARAGALAGAFIWALLFYTVAGLGLIFAFLISPELRAWSRMSIFLIALSLAFLAITLNRLTSQTIVRWTAVIVLATIAFIDQIAGIPSTLDLAPSRDLAYRAVVADAEKLLRPGCGVAQLPAKEFPESGPIGSMPDYNEALPYILRDRNTLRWSYGAVKGTRSGDYWEYATTPGAFRSATRRSQACAVLVDRLAYTDDVDGWRPFIRGLADPDKPDLTSQDPDHRYLLFRVRSG